MRYRGMALGAGGLLCKPALARSPLPETAAWGRIQTGAGTPILNRFSI